MDYKRQIGLVIGVLTAVIIWNLKMTGLSTEGQRCLALSLMTVIFWATKVAHPGYVSGLYLVSLVLFNIAPEENVFIIWTTPIIYLVIGAYLIAGAVESSGLGERIAYNFIIKFVDSYKSVIVSIFVLTFILSLLIPHPWPRAFLIMSVMAVVIKNANLSKEDAAKIGLTVFASSVPISMIFLTGDSTINIIAVEFSGVDLSWLGWFLQIGIPAILASIFTLILILLLFKPSSEFNINKNQIRKKLTDLGPLSKKEKRTIFWLSFVLILWMTDSIHGISLGWITLLVAMLMSMPVIGDVLTAKDWNHVPVHVLIFLTAAVSIGKIGELTGMNSWIASVVLPSNIPTNYFMLALLIGVISIFLHMILGSVIAVMGIAIPAFLSFIDSSLMSPLVPTLLVYSAIALHYIFPFHHLNMLVGLGKENGMYSDRDVIRLGFPLTIIVLIILLFEVVWWRFTGLL
ncbi:SLC13 family permease [Iocasia frigidifontis]|uniref:Sodium-dependent dicarboxylate transporter SdcS n=1 Tax=Iocasia fonsfrigidae TaxID=2682810 RepID=A0A8A7KDA0_9FIRM|nr:SLC13 family permease [Iocasia fonsfrigidae]QTL97389.1 SLC13 family permease [Iocasia fonsfrigidae]